MNEEDDYVHFLNGHESDCHPAAEFSIENFTSELPSLQDAYNEYSDLARMLVSAVKSE